MSKYIGVCHPFEWELDSYMSSRSAKTDRRSPRLLANIIQLCNLRSSQTPAELSGHFTLPYTTGSVFGGATIVT